MKKYKNIILMFALTLILGACNDFLDVEPSKSTRITPKTLSDIDALLNNYTLFELEAAKELIYGTDDFEVSPIIADSLSTGFNAMNAHYGTWDNEYTPSTNRQYWPEEWKKIFHANLILENLARIKDGSKEERQNLEAEAHFIIAYSYFNLANIYTLPYSEKTKNEMGLPIKRSTSFEEDLTRVSLEKTHQFIEENLKKALEINRKLEKVKDKDRIWRASSVAVNGFAGRYYLSRNDYQKAEQYANQALSEHAFLRNYNTDMYNYEIPTKVTVYNPDPVNIDIIFPYTYDTNRDPTHKMAWGETYYYRYLTNESFNYYPSQELLSLYDEEYDLRYRYHIIENYSYVRGAVRPAFKYPGYVFFYYDKIPSGPSVPEMLLTKAESQVRQGNWQQGLQTLNPLRQARMDQNAPADRIQLSAASQEEALKVVLEERRRELPFVHRWMDMRRFNTNEDPTDDVTIVREFYPYSSSTILISEATSTFTLETDSKLYARPIPATEIIASDGELIQNSY